MTTLEDVLAAHAIRATDPACSCGWDWDPSKCILPSEVDFDSSRYQLSDTVRPEQHRAHVADQIRAHLLSETAIDAVAEAIHDTENARTYGETARAAITAALDQPTTPTQEST